MYGVLKKKFGQNFLIDKNIQKKICQLIETKNLNIIEIGPGDGRLTNIILSSKPKKLKIIEVDNDLIPQLNLKFKEFDNLEIINEDIMNYEIVDKIDLIISNLPYNISSQILVKICLMDTPPSRLILMFQKEFALRLTSNKLNSINSLVSCFYNIDKSFNVSRNCFRPIPKVDSKVLMFSKKKRCLLKTNEKLKYIDFKRSLFSHKRKSLNNLLRKFKFINYKIDLNERIENLSVDQLLKIFRKVNS